MSDLHPSSLDVALDPKDTICKRKGCITSSGICLNRFQTLSFNSGTCKHQPKPASTFTDLGFSFSSRSSGRHTATSGVLDTRSGHCTNIKRREEEGVAKFGSYGVYPQGPKPPVWILTGETVGNKPVKVFLRVSEIDTIEADELPLTNAQRESFDILGLYVGTGECGLGRQACRQKCYVSGTGCRANTSGPSSSASGSCASCAPCCCPSGEIKDASAGCSFAYDQDCLWEGLHLVRLASNLKAAILNQLVQLLSGVNTGWQVAEVDPQIIDPVDFNPGNLLGLYQWDKNITGARLANVLNGALACPSVKISASEAAGSSLAFKGLVTLGPEYNAQTSFQQTRLGVVVDLGASTSQYYLAVVTIYAPVQTGVQPLSAPYAGNRLCCLFEDAVVDNSGNPSCAPVTSYLSMVYGEIGGVYFDFQIDNVVFSITDESQFFVFFESIPSGTATGTARTMQLGDQAFTVTPYSVLNIQGIAISATGSTAQPISLAVGAQGPLPLTASQQAQWGDLYVRVVAVNTSLGGVWFSVFRRTGLADYTVPTGPLLAASQLFVSTNLVNTSPPAITIVDVDDFPWAQPPSQQSFVTTSPQGYGFAQFVMTSAAVAVSALDTVAFQITFTSSDGGWVDETWEFSINPISDALSSTLSYAYFRVSPSVTPEVVVQDRQVSSFTLNAGTFDRSYQVVFAIFNGDWLVQFMPCFDSGTCDLESSLFSQ